MNFSELEALMSSLGVTTLADIARTLSTTPQAVSNWKARGSIPYHIEARLRKMGYDIDSQKLIHANLNSEKDEAGQYSQSFSENEINISIVDFFSSIVKNVKLFIVIPFTTVFFTIIYVQFIQQPLYVSTATILFSESSQNITGLSGLASQFGINIPQRSGKNLSSPSLIPELIKSRVFAERILEKRFYTDRYGKNLSFLSILTHGDSQTFIDHNTLIAGAMKELNKMLSIEKDLKTSINTISVKGFEPIFVKNLADSVISELKKLNMSYKSISVSEKKAFIEQRILALEVDLKKSEQELKLFRDQNRQRISPALELTEDRLTRNLDIQKGVYLTLKQQLELAKIEEIQESSILQILDYPQRPLFPINKNLKLGIFLAGTLGIGIVLFFVIIQIYFQNLKTLQRKNIRSNYNKFIKNIKVVIRDKKVIGYIFIVLILGLPFFLSYDSSNPQYFGKYSLILLLVNIFYVSIVVCLLTRLIYLTIKKQ